MDPTRLKELAGMQLNEGIKFKSTSVMLRSLLKELRETTAMLDADDERVMFKELIKKYEEAYVG